MAKAVTKPQITVTVVIELNEEEARALDALAGYGDESFIQMFYKSQGKHYMEPYEKGLREFLKTIRSSVAPALNSVDYARKALKESNY